MKKGLKITGIIIASAAVLYMMPFVTADTVDDAGRTWRVPFASSYVSDTGTEIVFSSIRSAYALESDASNAVHSYTETKCYGQTYYYNEESNVSISSYSASAGFPMNTVTYAYTENNACAGWTDDDEIAWAVGSINDVDMNISEDQAVEQGWYVVKDGTPVSSSVPFYNSFARLVKQSQPSYFRTLVIENGVNKIIDVQYMSDTSIEVSTRIGDSVDVQTYSYLGTEEIDGAAVFCAYYGSGDQEKPNVLYPVPAAE